jgi:hypothetical protein
MLHRISRASARLDGRVRLRQRACMHAERPAIAPSATGANGGRSASSSRRAMKKAHRGTAKGRKRRQIQYVPVRAVLVQHRSESMVAALWVLLSGSFDRNGRPSYLTPARASGGTPLTKHLEETGKTRKAKFDATAVSVQACACWSDDSRHCVLCR